ncbi:MAG: serine hydroxymethyltransferase [Clostridia bacterium]|nr:serine hydroxymethyltransferase [Clostridia bacterium]
MIDEKNTNDKEVFDLVTSEYEYQVSTVNLIASENYVSENVLRALGSVFTNKYAEGLPGRRYYSGCKFVDELENLAIERLTKLFGAEAGNVQPYSGTQANMAVYFAVLERGDHVLSMSLNDGGHLSHGALVNFSGELCNFVHYGVDKKGFIDYDNVEYLAKKHKPRLIVCGASSYSRVINFEKFREIADKVGAYLLADIAHIAGIIAAGLHPSPVSLADFITGTTQKTLRGPRGGFILCSKNMAKAVDRSIFPGMQGGPHVNNIAAKAVCFREAMRPEFKKYICQVLKNATAMAEEASLLGFDVISGGTDNHLLVLDLSKLGISGDKFQDMLDEVDINVTKQAVPNDRLGWSCGTSGIRVGSAAVTTRGFKEEDCRKVINAIALLRDNFNENKEYVKEKIKLLISNFPDLFVS